jgi:hypothetical protein
MTPEGLIAELRANINPLFVRRIGTESWERKRCADALESLVQEREMLLGSLIKACARMDRARGILTDDNPRPECNWGMLDTSDLKPK